MERHVHGVQANILAFVGDHSYRRRARRRHLGRGTARVFLTVVLFVAMVVGSLALRLHSDTSTWPRAIGFAFLGFAGLIVVLGVVFVAGARSRRRARDLDKSSPEVASAAPRRRRSLLPPGRLTVRVVIAIPFTLALLFMIDTGGPRPPGNDASAGTDDRLFGANLFGLLAILICTLARPTLQVFPWGVRIRNPIQALDLPWADIQAVEATDGGAMTITSATFGQVPVWVYQESPIGFLLGGYSAKRAPERHPERIASGRIGRHCRTRAPFTPRSAAAPTARVLTDARRSDPLDMTSAAVPQSAAISDAAESGMAGRSLPPQFGAEAYGSVTADWMLRLRLAPI